MRILLVAFSALALASGCRGAGPYGHSPNYVPLADEETAIANAREYDPVMAQRQPEAWRALQVSLFGIVTNRSSGPAGGTYLTLSLRVLEARNLCDTANDDDTCRVTVSDKDFGVIHVIAPLRPEDDVGQHSVGGGSLLRVVGKLGESVDSNDGAPVLRASYYRHWPRHYFVTKASAEHMRQ
jgi:hypothetical protein